MSDSVQPHRRQPNRLPRPWDSPGKNTGVGCHFLLQCMKVKSESEVKSCPTLATPWTAAYQAPPSMGFSRQKYWSGVPLPSPSYSTKNIQNEMFQEYLIPAIIQILEKEKKKSYRINWTLRRMQKESTREKNVSWFSKEVWNPILRNSTLLFIGTSFQISSEVGSIKYKHQLNKWASPVAMQENWVWSLGWEDLLEKGMATHSSILA